MSFRDIFRRAKRARQAGRPAAERDALTDVAFLRRLNRLALYTHPALRGHAVGQRPSWRRLPSSDFREHRLYLPGDDLRHVDWNASARSEHVFVKQGERPREASIHVLIDNTASMGWGTPSKLWAARRLAVALGYVALSHGDRLTVSGLADPAQRWGPVHGKGQVPRLLRFVRSLPLARQADAPAAARRLVGRHRHGGLVVVISDLLALPALGSVLDLFPQPAWQVLVVHLLHPAELDPSLRGEIELQDVETGERANYDLDSSAVERYRAFAREWCERSEQTCQERHAAYARVLSDAPIEQAVLPYLRRRGVVQAA